MDRPLGLLNAPDMPMSDPHPYVGAHLYNYSFGQYIEISANFIVGFIDHSLNIDNVQITNCTYQLALGVLATREAEGHFFANRWLEGHTEIENFLFQVDPIAKSCLPTYYSTYVNTREYYDTMNDVNRVFYNMIYRFIDIYRLSFDISNTAFESVQHSD
jgi:hypothetical protein